MIARFALLLACVASLSAAAHDLDRQAAARIAHIVVVGPGEPDHVPVRDPDIVETNSPDLGNHLLAWLTGGKNMTDARMDESMEGRDLDRILSEHQVQLGAELNASVAAGLTADGYNVQPDRGFDTDTSLNLRMDRIRYNGLPYHQHITPEIIVEASLVDLNTHDILFDKTYVLTDTDSPEIGSEEIAPDAAYVFTGYNTLVDEPERAIAGLRKSLATIAKAIAGDVAR